MARRDDRCDGGGHYGCACEGCAGCDKARARVTDLEAELRQSREEWQRWKATASSEEANETILMLEGDNERLRAALAGVAEYCLAQKKGFPLECTRTNPCAACEARRALTGVTE